MMICRILNKGEHEESCFVKVKHFSISKNSAICRYNTYKTTIFWQGDVNKAMLSRGVKSGIQAFGVHICGMFIYSFSLFGHGHIIS